MTLKATRFCVLNVGHYRTGSTTLAQAVEIAGYNVHRAYFGEEIRSVQHKRLLIDAKDAVVTWWLKENGKQELEQLAQTFDFISDGYIPWLLLLPDEMFEAFCLEMKEKGVAIHLLATTRGNDMLVTSELHQWVVNDLEARAALDFDERTQLEALLRDRALLHQQSLASHCVTRLALEEISIWYEKLEQYWRGKGCDKVSHATWRDALQQAGHCNRSPKLPLEGLLLTLRIGTGLDSVLKRVGAMLQGLRQDRLCSMLVILALDEDESSGAGATTLVSMIQDHCPSVHLITNPSKEPESPFAICQVWDRMATVAFEMGCDWVMLLGDDITIGCPFHYRAFYRAFLDISSRLNCPLGFGCPWWNDESFPGFPTFPVIGKAHYEIFGGLIPQSRKKRFVNQDLDPYLQRLYLQFGAASPVADARMSNDFGGTALNPARYERIPAVGWRNWVLQDVEPLKRYLVPYSDHECLIIDVVVPTFRIDMPYLEKICLLNVPTNVRTTFIVVVDNPGKLMAMFGSLSCEVAASLLEKHLSGLSGNNIRVRCNVVNSGASATRNRGLEESAAEYVLFLDDDVIPDKQLLFEYEKVLRQLTASTVGLVGMVRFPRRTNLSILHAAVLMSYLTFMFEIASNEHYKTPAWGVTANLLVKRSKTRFDTAYAKTGGGEDVDFCLHLTQETGGQLRTAPHAKVTHDYWPGGLSVILVHFFKWAIGDSALFSLYSEHCYSSFPNLAEFSLAVFLIGSPVYFGGALSPLFFPFLLFGLFFVDVTVDLFQKNGFEHRCSLLECPFSLSYRILAHCLANCYVIVLESGRLYGHWKRGELFRNACRRFDWHCGCLSNAKVNFTDRERRKFAGFCIVTAVVFYSCQRMNSKVTTS